MAKNKKIYKVGNRYVVKQNGKVTIVKKKKLTEAAKDKNTSKQKTETIPQEIAVSETLNENLETQPTTTNQSTIKIDKKLFIILPILSCLVVAIIITVSLISTAIKKPTDLKLIDETLTWTAIDDVNYYVLDINGTEYISETNSFDVSSLYPNTYKAKVRAVKNNRQSRFSSVLKFEIIKPILEVTSNNESRFVKAYDGTSIYDGTLQLGEHYYIESSQLKYGSDVDLDITEVIFNCKNVQSANKITVRYAGLKGESAKYYSIAPGTLIFDARIEPKQVQVSPNNFVKQFADTDNLYDEIIDEELNESVSLTYTRETGEYLGSYDILGAISSNPNYTITLVDGSGKDKFEIIPRVINVVGSADATVRKIYDGTERMNVSELNSDIYVIENIVSGYNVDIILEQALFNSANVTEAEKLTVYFSGTLIDPYGVYKTLKSSFEVSGVIEPKKVKIVPNQFKKQFGNEDELCQEYFDEETNQTVTLTFERNAGENIGKYNIIAAKSSSANFTFELIDNTGHNKFEIEKRSLTVLPTDAILQKAYDGILNFDGDVIKNVHYVLVGELNDYPVDIQILSALYDFATVSNANKVNIEISELLNDPNNVYKITSRSIVLNACITKKLIYIEPDFYSKQYGDADVLTAEYFDSETDTNIEITYSRTSGEIVGHYDIISAFSGNENFEFEVLYGNSKFEILKRQISVSALDNKLSKPFDNNANCDLVIEKGLHYKFENILEEEEPEITFISYFNLPDVNASYIILSDIILTKFYDRYELALNTINIPAEIKAKVVVVEPQYFTAQFGEVEFLRQSYTDVELDISFIVIFNREEGDGVGSYDIVSAVASNQNYLVEVINGEDKYLISPRVLKVDKVEGTIFNKIYDGTTDCTLPIIQGVHYNLENLTGGRSVSLNIIEKVFDSKNVAEVTKVIVRYAAVLDGADAEQFVTVGGTMEFDAVILPQPVDVIPEVFNKDYLSDFELRQKVLDPISGDIFTVSFLTTAGADHILTECGIYDIIDVYSEDPNHTAKLVNGTGAEKFIINRINLTINANNRNTVYNAQGQGINPPSSTPDRQLSVKYKITADSEEPFGSELPVNAGTYTARIIFEGDKNYLPQYIDRILFIDRAESVITNTTPSDYIYDGTIKPLTATLNHSEAPLAFSRNDYIDAGTYNYILISVPQTTNYKAASIIVSLTIARCIVSNEDINYPMASPITYGQYLYSSEFSGGSTLGDFSWSEPNIIPLVADTEFLVIFTPYDLINYDWTDVDMQRYVEIRVNKFVVLDLTLPTATGVVYTNALSTSQLIGTCEYGTFTWENGDLIPLASGYYNAVFEPYDEENYDFSNISRVQQIYVVVSFRTYFESNGGSRVETMIVNVIQFEPFTYREGYVFDGWYYDETLMRKAEFPLQITEDTVLYAGWYSEGLIFLNRGNHYSVMLDALTIETSIFIPSEYKGLPVTSIENEGFINCTALEVVVIPSTVVSIGHRAFVGCVNLAFVQIMNDIKNIAFGIDWIETGYIYGTDLLFNAEPCPDCDGTQEFHQSACEHFDELLLKYNDIYLYKENYETLTKYY